MSFIQIPRAYAADPGNIWIAKNRFLSSDAFAIVIRVQVSSDLVRKPWFSFDAVFQMVNPRMGENHWYIVSSNNSFEMHSKDTHWYNEPFESDDFAIAVSWDKYEDAVREIWGPERLKGLFYVRGSIDVRGTNLFAHSEEFWYKVGG